MRVMAGVFEPVQACTREPSRRTISLTGQTKPIHAAPTDSDASCRRRGSGLLGAIGEVPHQGIECRGWAKLLISLRTRSPGSRVGRAESCASSATRPSALCVSAGITGCSARTIRIEALMVVLKNVRSQPRQNPPGSKATASRTLPLRARSRTILPPRETPAASIGSGWVLLRKLSPASTRPANVSAPGVMGDPPYAGKSTARTRTFRQCNLSGRSLS